MGNKNIVDPVQILREKNKNAPQFIYGDECIVTDGFYKGQIVWIEDIRDTIPGDEQKGIKEIFLTYACRVGIKEAYTIRIIEGKYLEKHEYVEEV